MRKSKAQSEPMSYQQYIKQGSFIGASSRVGGGDVERSTLCLSGDPEESKMFSENRFFSLDSVEELLSGYPEEIKFYSFDSVENEEDTPLLCCADKKLEEEIIDSAPPLKSPLTVTSSFSLGLFSREVTPPASAELARVSTLKDISLAEIHEARLLDSYPRSYMDMS